MQKAAHLVESDELYVEVELDSRQLVACWKTIAFQDARRVPLVWSIQLTCILSC